MKPNVQTILDWKVQDEKGCGITWENVSSSYSGLEDFIKRLRSDLKYIDMKEVLPTLWNAQYQNYQCRKNT
jgi:hypothetical protein